MTATAVQPALWRIVFAGSLSGGEIFDHGMWVNAPTAATATDIGNAGAAWLTAFLAATASPLVGPANILGIFPPNVVWSTVAVRPYDIATGMPTALPTTFSVHHAGTGGQTLPYECAFVITLWNGAVTGRRRYNRFYLPPLEVALLSTNGEMQTGVPQCLINAVVVGNTAMQALTPQVAMCYYSPTGHSKQPLLEAWADIKVDSQRRRENQLTTVPLTHAF